MKMPKEKIETSMFAPCGMNCKVCYKHCYHKKSCAGCLNSDIGKPEHCRKCKIKDCIIEKALSYCFVSWNSRKKNIFVLNVAVLFLFTIENVVSVKKK